MDDNLSATNSLIFRPYYLLVVYFVYFSMHWWSVQTVYWWECGR